MLHPSELRRRIAAAILEKLGGTGGWVQSSVSYYATLPTNSSSKIGRSFRVGVLSSIADDPDGRQRAAVGTMVTTTIGVRWSGQIPADDPVEGVDGCLEDEVDLHDAIMSMDRNPGIAALRLDVIDRATNEDGTVFDGEMTFLVRHLYPRRA